MAETFTKTKIYYPSDPKDSWRSDFKPFKELTANTPEELEALLRIGWKLEAK